MTLTVIIPTLNEEIDLPRTLQSVNFANEIIVIDAGSTDKTVQIARKKGARVIHHDFINFADTRNFADQKATGDWILSIEADVVVSAKLAIEIKEFINIKYKILKAKCARIGRVNYIWGKPITVADWGPKDDCHIRLYQKKSGYWQSRVHELFIPAKGSLVTSLKNYLFHYNYTTVSEFIAKTNSYSDLAVKNNQKINYLTPVIDFSKRYFYKFGFLAGYRGLFLCYLQAVYYLNILIKSD